MLVKDLWSVQSHLNLTIVLYSDSIILNKYIKIMTHVNIEPAHLKSIESECFQSSVKPFTVKFSHFFKQNILNANHTHNVLFHYVKKHLYFLLK